MDVPRPERGWTLPPQIVDALLAGFITLIGGGFALGGIERGDRPGVIVASTILGVLGGISVAWRRRYPLWVLWIVQASTAGHLALSKDWPQAGGLAIAVVLYAVARTRDRDESRRIAVGVWFLNCLLIVILAGIVGGVTRVVGDLFVCTILLSGSWAFGDNRRTRQAYFDSLVERARRLEAEREEQAARAVLDERTRIARELHDAVAHHVSAIAVMAGAAEEVAEADPVRARDALRSIQATSRDALAEMRAIVGVLSSAGEAEYAPQPGLRDVDRLVAQTRAAGLPVTLRVEGTPRPLPEALDLSAYRIVQEALTNTLKHAGEARAEVVVRYEDADVVLEVTDDGAGAPPSVAPAEAPHPGRGLIGMRERVALFHGDLAAGPGPRGGFRVEARLPVGGVAS